MSLVPLGFIVWITIDTGWAEVIALIFRNRVGELLVNTVLLELCTIPLCILLAVTLAWLTERTDIPGARIWSWLAVAPLAVPAFVHSYAWVSLVPSMHGLWSGVLVSVLAYFPFLYLPVAAALRRLDPAIEDAAASLGLGPWRVFFRAVLPQHAVGPATGRLRDPRAKTVNACVWIREIAEPPAAYRAVGAAGSHIEHLGDVDGRCRDRRGDHGRRVEPVADHCGGWREAIPGGGVGDGPQHRVGAAQIAEPLDPHPIRVTES